MPGLYEALRPHDIDPDEWECWMHEYGRSVTNADVYEYNRWWVSKVKSDILASLVRPEEETKRRRRLGRWRTKGGLSMSDRRPDLIKSITDYGGLFFETPFGSHRKFVKEKGRKSAGVGHTVIAWHTGRESWKEGKIRCKGGRSYDGAAFYHALATVFAIVEDAERRGDRATLVVAPRELEANMESVLSQRFTMQRKSWRTRIFGPNLQIFAELNMFETLINRRMSPAAGTDVGSAIAGAKAAEAGAWGNMKKPAGGFYTVEWSRDEAEEDVRRWFSGAKVEEYSDASNMEISAALFYERSVDYEGIRNRLLAVSPRGLTIQPNFASPLMVGYEVFTQSSKEVRGTMIMVAALDRPTDLYMFRHYLREIDRSMDIVFIDLGELDLSQLFLEPEMTRNGRPLVRYVYVGDDIAHMTERVIKAIGGTIDGVSL